MDKTFKINEIVYRLRKAKGITQRELADKLHTTAKTICNWERNKNSIPAEMISNIAKELDIDKEFLYNNYIDIVPHRDDIKFFCCPECKSVFWSFSKSMVTCCNHKLSPLTASPENSSHYLYTENNPLSGTFTVSASHPQNTNHRIEFVAYVSDNDVHIYPCPENKPVRISIPRAPGGKLYMFCSKHGLFHDGIFY